MVLPLVCAGSQIGPDPVVRQLVQERVVEPLFSDHYLIGDVPLSVGMRARIAQQFTPPHAVLAILTATWVYVGGRAPEQATVVLQAGSPAPSRKLRVRVVRTPLTSADITKIDGVAVTSLERTVMDLARWEPTPVAWRAIKALVAIGADLRAAGEMVPETRRNSARARELIAQLARTLE